jgi:hypothetical protein
MDAHPTTLHPEAQRDATSDGNEAFSIDIVAIFSKTLLFLSSQRHIDTRVTSALIFFLCLRGTASDKTVHH